MGEWQILILTNQLFYGLYRILMLKEKQKQGISFLVCMCIYIERERTQ